MNRILHITNGDVAGQLLEKTGLPGELLVWRDVLYEGPRNIGWPDDDALAARARFLQRSTGGRLDKDAIGKTLTDQYRTLIEAKTEVSAIVLWFDACLFDQSMLAHILACMHASGMQDARLICVDRFPGITPFHGLGQLSPWQMASLYDRRRPVTEEQFRFAVVVDQAFALQDPHRIGQLARQAHAPLPWIPAAARRWLAEQPDPQSGLTRLQRLALEAIREGCATPHAIFKAVAAAETPPQFWGNTTLWARINDLADRDPPLVRIDGPAPRLPQWESELDLESFTITPF